MKNWAKRAIKEGVCLGLGLIGVTMLVEDAAEIGTYRAVNRMSREYNESIENESEDE